MSCRWSWCRFPMWWRRWALPISVVDSGTLVVNVVEVSDGVMTNVCLSRVSVGADCVVTGVVNKVFCGVLHSSDICTTVYTRAAMRAARNPRR